MDTPSVHQLTPPVDTTGVSTEVRQCVNWGVSTGVCQLGVSTGCVNWGGVNWGVTTGCVNCWGVNYWGWVCVNWGVSTGVCQLGCVNRGVSTGCVRERKEKETLEKRIRTQISEAL